MSIKAVEAALNHYPHGGSKKLALIALAEQANAQTGVCWPSVETISSRACISYRSALYAIKDLESEGVIEVRRHRGKKGKKTSNFYRVRVDFLESMPSLLEEDYGDINDMFPPIDKQSNPVDNPVEKLGKTSSLGANRMQNLCADFAHKPERTVNKTNNKACENVENLVSELSERMAMPND